MEKIFCERISEELLKRIKIFLDENQSEILDYTTCMEGYKLADAAFKELYDGLDEYRKEYDSIIKDFDMCMNPDIKIVRNNNEVVKKMNILFSKYKRNDKIWEMIYSRYKEYEKL